MFEEKINQLAWLAGQKLGLVLCQKQLDQFVLFGRLLLEWNQRMNLTRITDPGEVIIKHFLDSLGAHALISGVKVCDIGTGAGFPGIPLAIAKPELDVTLVDSLAKRVDFLTVVNQELGLNVVTRHARVEDFGRTADIRGTFDTVVSRAVASLPVLSEYALPLLRLEGVFCAYKGMHAFEEIRASEKALELLGGRYEQMLALDLGSLAEHRAVVVIRKVKETPSKFPRKAGEPERKPLG